MTDSVYTKLWEKLNLDFRTAPKDDQGNPQPSFLKFIALVYSTEEAELLSHMNLLPHFSGGWAKKTNLGIIKRVCCD